MDAEKSIWRPLATPGADKLGKSSTAIRARKAERILSLIEAHLTGKNWLALGRPTICLNREPGHCLAH